MDDFVALVKKVRALELAASEDIVSLDMAAVQAVSSPDLIHITVDGRLRDCDDFLRMVASNPGRQAIHSGPMEAIVIAPDAVLLSYPLSEQSVSGNETFIAHEHVSVLWMKRSGRWQNVFIHATSRLAATEASMGTAIENSEVVNTLVVHKEGMVAVDEATLAARKLATISLEKGAVDHFRRHDIPAATESTHEQCVLIETDGSRQGRAHWLALVGDERRRLEEPVFGEFEVLTITPEAILVIYTMETQGTYDGAAYTNSEALSALWVLSEGRWQAIFMQATIRSLAPLHY